MRRRTLVLTLLFAGLVGCSEPIAPTAPHLGLIATTDKTAYSLASDSVAWVSLVNTSSRDVYLPMAEYVVYEQLVDGEWRNERPWFTTDGTSPVIRLAAGREIRDDLPIWFYIHQPGTYRIRYLVYLLPDRPSLLDERDRVSPPFTISE